MQRSIEKRFNRERYIRGLLAFCGLILVSSFLVDYNAQNVPAERNAKVISGTKPSIPALVHTPAQIEKEWVNQTTSDNNVPSQLSNQTWRFCNALEKVAPAVYSPGESHVGFSMRYRCEGPNYDLFSEEMHSFVWKKSKKMHPLWGKRGLRANSTILIVGSSHLQQVAQSIVCQENQYGSGLVTMKTLDKHGDRAVMVRYTFGNGAVIYHAANTYAVHLNDWPSHLAKQTGLPSFEIFDKVIVGTTNSCTPPIQTTFATDMIKLLEEELGATCELPDGPSFSDYAAVFQQPLLYVSMFAKYARSRVSQDTREWNAVKANGNHSNAVLAYVDARKYIKDMGVNTWECGSLSTKTKFDCVNNETARDKLHRCTGRRGAHPDLIAWDVVEFLNSNYRGLYAS
mmetsp:Transcript_29/g.50  ORF Transcript_29/g.50 Transcript_29/m.50 type:complete len:399 (-) Transcript_29:124-1320(-)